MQDNGSKGGKTKATGKQLLGDGQATGKQLLGDGQASKREVEVSESKREVEVSESKRGGGGKECAASGANPPAAAHDSSKNYSMAEQETSVKLKTFCKKVTPIWQEYFGKGAVLNLPDKSKDRIEFITETNDNDMLLEAFRLFAKDQFDHGSHDPWAIGKFASQAEWCW